MDLAFFHFGSKLSNSTYQAHAVGLDSEPSKNEADHWKLIEGNYGEIEFPVVFKHYCGKKMCDILDTGWVSLYLISDRMKKILEENSFTGYKTFPIRLLDKKNQEVTGYSGFSIIGRCGTVRFDKSNVIFKQFNEICPVCKYYKGSGFDLESWDKSDFFLPVDSYQVIVTEKVEKILGKNKLTNLRLINLKDEERSADDVERIRENRVTH